MMVSNHFVKSQSGKKPTCKWQKLVRDYAELCKAQLLLSEHAEFVALTYWSQEWPRSNLADQGQVLGLAGQLLLIDCNLTCSMS